MSKTHTYRGYDISPVQYADKKAQGYRWYIGVKHSTGIIYDSSHCPHYFTLAQAREAIDRKESEAAYAS